MIDATYVQFEGKKESSLLTEFFFPSQKEKFQEFLTRLNEYLEKYKKTSDHRALAIIGASIVENELDKFLSVWIKDYKDLKDNKEFTLSLKVELAISLKLIPKQLLNAIVPIRKIRNIFAHHFEIDTFEQAKAKEPKTFEMLANKMNLLNLPVGDDDIKNFQNLIKIIILGLNVYADQLMKIQDYIWKSKNRNRIINQNQILKLKRTIKK